jgi:hypothetical protein
MLMRQVVLSWDHMAGASVVIAGVVEAAQQALGTAPKVLHALPAFVASGNWNYVPLGLITLAGLLWIVKQLRGSPFPQASETAKQVMIGIQTPRGGEELPWEQVVRGCVFPADTPIQVFVYSGDDQWHPQGPFAQVNRFEWTNKCHFGNPNSGYGPHRLVAITGTDSVNHPVRELPAGAIRSNIVNVARKAD